MAPRWRTHEKHSRRSAVFKGYNVTAQKSSTHTGKRPDYFGVSKRNPKKRIIGEAKCVKELTDRHVDQVRGYKGYPFFAQKGVIFVKKTTKVPREVRSRAKESNIKIIRRRVRKESGWSWW
jgi:hypothetical protein